MGQVSFAQEHSEVDQVTLVRARAAVEQKLVLAREALTEALTALGEFKPALVKGDDERVIGALSSLATGLSEAVLECREAGELLSKAVKGA